MRSNTTLQYARFDTIPDVENATLSDVCGGLSSHNNRSIAFIDDHTPDQYFRVVTSAFNHAGLVHLVMSMALQWILLEGLEKRLGSTKVATVYMYAAIMGNLLASATVPAVRVYVGPGGALFGIVACHLVCLWFDKRFSIPTCQPRWLHIAVPAWCVGYVLLGLAPGVENMTAVGGFLSGLFCSVVLILPQLQMDYIASKIAHLENGQAAMVASIADELPIKRVVMAGMVASFVWTLAIVLAFSLRDFASDPTGGLAGISLGCVDAEACSVFQGIRP
jgi:membrane associated rhomboid family serine protease